MGEIAVSRDGNTLTVAGVGSCVVVSLWDPQLKIGALSHAMLPSRNGRLNQSEEGLKQGEYGNQDTRYVYSAINEMLKNIDSLGVKREDIEAKIIGGANMFSAFESDIGKENILSAKSKLKEEGIKIVGECVGGSQGRSVEFSIISGIVTVKTKF